MSTVALEIGERLRVVTIGAVEQRCQWPAVAQNVSDMQRCQLPLAECLALAANLSRTTDLICAD